MWKRRYCPWSILILLALANTTSAELIPTFMTVEGAASSSTRANTWVIAAGPPFYEYFKDMNVTIIFPVNATTYYRNTLDVNVTTDRGTSNCSYRINAGGYNNMTCAAGNCTNQVTFPNGEVTLAVNCTADGETGSDSITFTILLWGPSGGPLPTILLALGLLFLYFAAVDDCKKRPPQRDSTCP